MSDDPLRNLSKGNPVAAAGLDVATVRERTGAVLEQDRTVELLEEEVDITKRETVTGTVRVLTRTETVNDIASIALDRSFVEVVRVPMEMRVDALPPVRTEGDTTIIPVIEERAVVVKHLYLVEEIHVRQQHEQQISRTPVQLRHQVATVERIDADGTVTDGQVFNQPATASERDPEGQHNGHS